MERIQPDGVLAVGILTVLIALGLLFLAYIALGAAPNEASALTVTRVLVFLVGGGVLLLVDAAFIFLGMRIGYFLSVISWVLALAVNAWWAILGVGTVFLFVGSPFIFLALYCIACLAYFSTGKVRTYFDV